MPYRTPDSLILQYRSIESLAERRRVINHADAIYESRHGVRASGPDNPEFDDCMKLALAEHARLALIGRQPERKAA